MRKCHYEWVICLSKTNIRSIYGTWVFKLNGVLENIIYVCMYAFHPYGNLLYLMSWKVTLGWTFRWHTCGQRHGKRQHNQMKEERYYNCMIRGQGWTWLTHVRIGQGSNYSPTLGTSIVTSMCALYYAHTYTLSLVNNSHLSVARNAKLEDFTVKTTSIQGKTFRKKGMWREMKKPTWRNRHQLILTSDTSKQIHWSFQARIRSSKRNPDQFYANTRI